MNKQEYTIFINDEVYTDDFEIFKFSPLKYNCIVLFINDITMNDHVDMSFKNSYSRI